MLFNSIEFALFLPLVFALYWLFNSKIKIQNLIILISSFIFYGWWDWRFLFLIALSTLVDFNIGLAIGRSESSSKRKALLWTSILVNIGLLGFFKYYNFFIENFVEAFRLFGIRLDSWTLSIILPVGISFYTFQTLSYTIDVYRKNLKPTKDIIAFSSFVSFFPQLVAGPIERATNLLPQFQRKRSFDYAKSVDGMRQILYGLFKKIVIADNCALVVNEVFADYANQPGSALFYASILFGFQIYCDFSGYSDIAIGTARLFGFSLMKNFAFPYFSRDIAEFWRRWHISLSTWFRDYVYIPLGGSKGSKTFVIRNVFIIFLVSGLWHGANWTFIIWGFLNALFILPLIAFNRHRVYTDSIETWNGLPGASDFFRIVFTFSLTSLAWIFFRAEDLGQAFGILDKIFSSSLLNSFSLDSTLLFLLLFFICWEWNYRNREHGLQLGKMFSNRYLRWGVYYFFILLIVLFSGKQADFIYFQF